MNRRAGLASWLGWMLLLVLVAGACDGSGDPAAGGATAAPSTAPPATEAPTTTTEAPAGTGTTATRAPARARYRFPVAGCRADYGSTHHDYPAADIFADRGCLFVAPGTIPGAIVSRWEP